MGLRAHDLLRVSDLSALLEFHLLPKWARDSLSVWPFVVVRRATAPKGLVAIGIRGAERSQRAAALLPIHAVTECVSPEDLAARKPWLRSDLRATLPQLVGLKRVAEAAEGEGLMWGPIGSVGFELATGAHVVREESDLDVLVRFDSHTSTEALRRFRTALTNAPIQVDILLEGDGRAVALDEYLCSPDRVLIKTPDGPELGVFAG